MESRKSFIKELTSWVLTILSAVALALCIRSYAFASPEIRQNSMQNTLLQGQRVIEFKIEYYFSKPKRNDIVIINRKAEKGFFRVLISNSKDFFQNLTGHTDKNIDEIRLIKRVIGIPGDVVDIKNEKVYINGKALNETYVKGKTNDSGMKLPVTVPENKYFVLGDNREASLDSRVLGFIDRSNIEGKAVFRFWPLNKFGGIYN